MSRHKPLTKIDKGVPIPPDPRRGYKADYPLAEMNIGDSILMNVKSRQSIYYYKYRYAPTFEFTARREGDKYRVWRTA